ncbi:MAG TPA: sulfotransferase domain-containing protein [Bauldia sp.]|nr:sulfotransferase domain-containing protein [Bauldia sp.]
MIRLDAAHPKGIVWLASYPKSGNTWLRAFLYSLLLEVTGTRSDDLDLDAVAYFGESESAVPHYRRHLSESAVADRAAVAAVRPKVQAEIAANSPGLVMIKTHNALIDYLGSPLIDRSVSAGAVYVVRNPLDIAISLAHFRAVSIDDAIDEMGRSGRASETNSEDVYYVAGSWSEHVRSWTAQPSSAILPVRYEDLLANPAETFAGIATHLRIPARAEQIGHAVELTRFDRMQKAEHAHGFLEKPPNVPRFFREGRAGQWERELSAAQVERIVATHGSEMARFGYLPA